VEEVIRTLLCSLSLGPHCMLWIPRPGMMGVTFRFGNRRLQKSVEGRDCTGLSLEGLVMGTILSLLGLVLSVGG